MSRGPVAENRVQPARLSSMRNDQGALGDPDCDNKNEGPGERNRWPMRPPLAARHEAGLSLQNDQRSEEDARSDVVEPTPLCAPAATEDEAVRRIMLVRRMVADLSPAAAKQVLIALAQDEIGVLTVGQATEIIRDMKIGNS